jgi:hypothetical protein
MKRRITFVGLDPHKNSASAIIIFELPFRGSLPQGAGHEKLEGLRRDDHHGVGWDWTSEHGNWQRR